MKEIWASAATQQQPQHGFFGALACIQVLQLLPALHVLELSASHSGTHAAIGSLKVHQRCSDRTLCRAAWY